MASTGELLARNAEAQAQALDAYAKLRKLWANNPERYVRQRLNMRPTWQQRQALEAIREDGAKVSIRSGHGIGKSGIAAGIILWFLETRDFPKIPCTAPTSHQLRDVLWAEISKWIRTSDAHGAKTGVPRRLWLSTIFTITNDRIYDPSAKGEWFATARTATKDNPDALQGFHASDLMISEDGMTVEEHGEGGQLLFVVDEASAVPDQVFIVAEGALASPDSRLIMLANPTRNSGYFADSQKRNRSGYTTLHFKSADSPLVDPSYRQQLVAKWGDGSNIVRVRADGEFPKQDDDVLISLEVAEPALQREKHAHPDARRRLGIDVARYGNDRTVYIVRADCDILAIKITAKKSTMETVGTAVEMRREYRCDEICPDVIGVGAGVVDRLIELQQPVVPVNAAERAPSRHRARWDGDKDTGKRHDADGKIMRDYLWLEMADWWENSEPSLIDAQSDAAEDLVGEVTSVRYGLDSDGRIVIESKDKIKGRIGFSPDLADALACTFVPGAVDEGFAVAGSREF